MKTRRSTSASDGNDTAAKPSSGRSRLRWWATGAVAAALLAAAGCGSSASTTTSAGGTANNAAATGTSGGAPTSAIVTDSRRIVAAAESGLVSTPSEAFAQPAEIKSVTAFPSPSPVAWKAGSTPHRVAIVACEQQGLCGRLAQVQAAVFKRLGWQVSTVSAVFSAGVSANQAFQQAWNAAAAHKPNVILALAVSGLFVQQQLQQAKAAGITTIDVFQGPESGPGYDVYVPASFNVQRELQAAYSVATTDGKARNLVLDLQGFPNLMTQDEKQYLSLCGGCKTDVTPVQIADNIDPIKAAALSSSLARRTQYDYLSLSTGGGANAGYEQGLSESGSSAKYLSVDAIPENSDLLHGGSFAAVAWVPADWVALAGVDATLRAVSGAPQPPLNQWNFGAGLWTPGSAPAKGSSWSALTAAELKRFDFLAPYAKAWRLPESDLQIAG